MEDKNVVDVLIAGRKYTICAGENEEYVQKVAMYINQKMADFKKMENYRSMDLELRNILLAMNIADDYFKAKKKGNEYHSEVELKDRMVLEMKHKVIDAQEKEKDLEDKIADLNKQMEELKKKNIELETRLKQKR